MGWIDNFDLNTTVTFYSRTEVNDGMGGNAYTNTSRGSAKCAFWQLSAFERIQGNRVKNNSTHKIALKPNSSYAASDFVVIESNTYKISTPNNIMEQDDIMTIDLELTE